MGPDDLVFRKRCQEWHLKVRKLLKQDKVKEAKEMREKIAQALLDWQEHERSVRFRTNILKNLLIMVDREVLRRSK